MEKVIDQLEAEANRKGYTGYPEPVFTEGFHVGDRTRYSDRLLMFRLKALAAGEMPRAKAGGSQGRSRDRGATR